MSDHTYSDTTPSDGRINFGQIPIGEYEVTLSHPDYDDRNEIEQLDTGGRAPIYEMTPSVPDGPVGDPLLSRERYTGVQPRHADRIQESEADVTVASASSLQIELDNADSGDIIYVDDNATINGDNLFRVRVPEGVTVASNGALFELSENNSGMFWLETDTCRVTGIRFRGFHYDDMADGPYTLPAGTTPWGEAADYAIKIRSDAQVDNCRFEGFCFTGIVVGENQDNETQYDPHPLVRNCEFERNLLEIGDDGGGLGYGIACYSGSPLIRYCYFNNNRHSVVGGGANRSRWTVRDSYFGTEGLQYGAEMHEGTSGGRWVRFNNNESAYVTNNDGNPRPTVMLRSTPTHESRVTNNIFYKFVTEPLPEDPESPIRQLGATGSFNNVVVQDNHFGETEPEQNDIGIRKDGKDYVDLVLSIEVNDVNGDPISGNLVANANGRTFAGSNGTVDVLLPTGDHTVRVGASDYSTETLNVTMTDKDESTSVSLEEAEGQGALQLPSGPEGYNEPHFESTVTNVQKVDDGYVLTVVVSNQGGEEGTTTLELRSD